jgi:hypothetical protein
VRSLLLSQEGRRVLYDFTYLAGGRFRWLSFDVSSLMPENWRTDILRVAGNNAQKRNLVPPHSTSREDSSVASLPIHGVRGEVVWSELPWLIDLYRNLFRDLAQQYTSEKVSVAKSQRYGTVLNIQRGGGERYECHVDSNPIEGLLYVTSHPVEMGGELVVANNVNADSVEKVDADCSIIYPQAGHVVFFDGRSHPHYVRPLIMGDLRVAVAMNFYTESVPESTRPRDLDAYLYGTATRQMR